MSAELRPGDQAWLVPTLPTAPTVAYRQPEVTVIEAAWPRVAVRLADGTRVETDARNVRRTPPPAPSTEAKAPRARYAALRDGSEEITLW